MTLELINDELTDTNIRILKEESCPSLSGSTTLTYQIGCNEHNDILFRIHNNSGTGKFNRDWVPSGDMLELIYESKEPFSWKVLYPLVKGKSVNTAGFLMAALMNEGLINRLYEQKSSAEFQDRIKVLMTESKPRKKKKKGDSASTTKKGAK